MERIIKLSLRLQSVADYIEEGASVADIGTDHGYLPVYLAQTGKASRIIASDKSAGSLKSAVRSAAKYGVSDKMTFVLSPGLSGIAETDVDTIVIAGVGGETIVGILKEAPWTKEKRLILQPQTKFDLLNYFLRENGYRDRETTLVHDRRRLYSVMLVEACDRAYARARTRARDRDHAYDRTTHDCDTLKGETPMPTVNEVFEYLDSIAPVSMKMETDNVGFLVGRSDERVTTMLVSLDITSEVISEAIALGAELIVSHHPMFFSLKSITDKDTTGKRIVNMLGSGISAICMHTNLDAARGGINDALAVAVGIADDSKEAELLTEHGVLPSGEVFSYGRLGYLKAPCAMPEFLSRMKDALNADGLRYHDAGRPVYKVAVVGGSGGDDFEKAAAQGCDTFVSADLKYHLFLEAKERGINLIDGDHFCTENLVMGNVAERLGTAFPGTKVVLSQRHAPTAKFY